MSDPIIKIKRSSVPGKIPTSDQLPVGQLAVNTYDGILFSSKNVGVGTTVIVINPWIVDNSGENYNISFSSGNVGIGTDNTDESKLKVQGNLRVTGSIKDSSGDSGTSGFVLKSTVTGTDWVNVNTLLSGKFDGGILSHPQSITADYIIPVNNNARSFGPEISVSEGVTVTVSSGSFWSVV